MNQGFVLGINFTEPNLVNFQSKKLNNKRATKCSKSF
jgi:hypothetical protein